MGQKLQFPSLSDMIYYVSEMKGNPKSARLLLDQK